MRLWAAAACAVVLAGLGAPACSAPAPEKTRMISAPVTLSRETPRREVPVPAGVTAPKAVAVRLDPVAGAPGAGVEVWLVRPDGQRVRLGAASPYPPGEAGEFLMAWPAGQTAAGARIAVELAPGEAQAQTRVSVGWR